MQKVNNEGQLRWLGPERRTEGLRALLRRERERAVDTITSEAHEIKSFPTLCPPVLQGVQQAVMYFICPCALERTQEVAEHLTLMDHSYLPYAKEAKFKVTQVTENNDIHTKSCRSRLKIM